MTRTPVLPGRRVARRVLDGTLGRVGARVMTAPEQEALDRRYASVVEQLAVAYAGHFSPPLADREGRNQLLCALRGTDVTEALHLLHHLHGALDGPGDVCEFGVAQGTTSALVANELLPGQRNLWLYDSFEGLSAPTPDDDLIDDIFRLGAMEDYAGTMAYPRELVERRLADVGFPAARTRIVAGFIRDDLPADQLPETVAFAYLDFDLYEPILTALDLLHPRCRKGSTLMVDDYDYFSSGPRKAVEEFLARHPDEYDLVEPEPPVTGFCALRRR